MKARFLLVLSAFLALSLTKAPVRHGLGESLEHLRVRHFQCSRPPDPPYSPLHADPPVHPEPTRIAVPVIGPDVITWPRNPLPFPTVPPSLLSNNVPLGMFTQFVTRAEAIAQYESFHLDAVRAIGQPTDDISKSKIYLARVRNAHTDCFYAESNYRPATGTPSHPVKGVYLAGFGTHRSLSAITSELILTPNSSASADALASAEVLQGRVEVFADDDFFRQTGVPLFDLTPAKAVYHLDRNHAPERLLRTNSSNPPPYAVELTAALRVKFLPGSKPAELLGRLQNEPFSPANVSFVNLIGETAVEAAVQAADRVRQATVAAADVPHDKEALLALVREHHGKILLALGHSDGEHFVVDAVDGHPGFEVPLTLLADVAHQAGCVFMALGCESGQADVALGAVEVFNPAKAVEALQKSLDTTNFAAFMTALAGNSFHLILDEKRFTSALAFEMHKPLLPEFSSAARILLAGVLVLPAATHQTPVAPTPRPAALPVNAATFPSAVNTPTPGGSNHP